MRELGGWKACDIPLVDTSDFDNCPISVGQCIWMLPFTYWAPSNPPKNNISNCDLWLKQLVKAVPQDGPCSEYWKPKFSSLSPEKLKTGSSDRSSDKAICTSRNQWKKVFYLEDNFSENSINVSEEQRERLHQNISIPAGVMDAVTAHMVSKR